LTVVVPEPDEPVTAMIGCFLDTDLFSAGEARVCRPLSPYSFSAQRTFTFSQPG
jgi:hypothetical protein